MSDRPIEAAGAVVWKRTGHGHDVLLIHRPRYDDWSLPKGKLDPGEHPATAAVRETREETGVAVRLGPRLTRHEYRLRSPQVGTKRVTYWSAAPVDGVGLAADHHQPNDEVDAVRWVPLGEAARQLSYARDGDVVAEFEQLVRVGGNRSSPLAVLRHAAAVSRKSWHGSDDDRPLSDAGSDQADRLVGVLAAFGVNTVLSSDSHRCVRTVRPYARAVGLDVHRHPRWSEASSSRRDVSAAVGKLAAGADPLVLCTHRPVLPWVFEGIGVSKVKLEPADLFVVHRRNGDVCATEVLRL